MADFTAKDGPERVGDVSQERARERLMGLRGRRGRGRCAAGFPVRTGEEAGLPENDTSGEKGGEAGSDGEESWRGEIGRLRGEWGRGVDCS